MNIDISEYFELRIRTIDDVDVLQNRFKNVYVGGSTTRPVPNSWSKWVDVPKIIE